MADDAHVESTEVAADLGFATELARVVHGPTSPEEKVRWVLAQLAEGSGAELVAFCASGPGGESVTEIGDATLLDLGSRDVRARLRRAVETDDVAWPAARRAATLVVVAVRSDTGVDHGVVVLAHRQPSALDERAETAARALAVHLGIALDNTLVVDELRTSAASQREVVHQLQDAVRPPVPTVPHAELGVCYEAADPAEPTGGDLYDWQRLPDGQLHIAVVDVMGKGVAATKDALTLTHGLRMLSLEGVDLTELLPRVREVMDDHAPELVATFVVGRYRPDTGELTLAGAGHPPPLLINVDGTTRFVETGGLALGYPGDVIDPPVKVTLERSDTLVLYTDGLIEANRDVVLGMAQLRHAGRRVADYPASAVASALVRIALEGGQRRDDSLAVVLRRRVAPVGTGSHPLAKFEHRFHPLHAAIPIARQLLADWLHHQPMDPLAADDLLLVADELCSNAVAAGDPNQPVVLRARVEGDAVAVEVEDRGRVDPALPTPALPEPMAETGRGLFIARALSDELSASHEGDCTVLRAVKRAVVASPD